MALVIMAIGKIFHSVFNLTNVALLYLLPVLFAAVFWGLRLSVFASIVSVLAFDFFFVPPVLTFTVADLNYITVFIVFFLVALITGSMATSLRNQAASARQRERRTAALYKLSSKIAAESEIDPVLKTVTAIVAETMEGAALILMPDGAADRLILRAYSDPIAPQLTPSDLAVATWTYENCTAAGRGGALEPEKTEYFFLPMKTDIKKLGVLGYKLKLPEKKQLVQDQQQLLEAFSNLAVVAVVRLQLAAEAEQARHLVESERLRTALFNSLSHALRTPLSSITGAVTGLLEEGEIYDSAARRDLLQTIKEGAFRLNRLVGNLLDMARLESGMLKLKKEWCDIQDIIGVVLRQIQEAFPDSPCNVNIPPELPLVRVDFSLIEQVFINLLENAAKYAPPGSEISIVLFLKEKVLQVEIADWGPGIPPGERERIFDKFYRLRSPRQVGGTGLGLSICKGIIEAHGGRIWVAPRPQNDQQMPEPGSVFIFTLPLDKMRPDRIPSGKAGDLVG